MDKYNNKFITWQQLDALANPPADEATEAIAEVVDEITEPPVELPVEDKVFDEPKIFDVLEPTPTADQKKSNKKK